MNNANQFASIDEAAESVDVVGDIEMDKIPDTQPSVEADIMTDKTPDNEADETVELRTVQLEAQIKDLNAQIVALSIKLADAEALAEKQATEIEHQKTALMAASSKDFRRGQEISRLEKQVQALNGDVEKASRLKNTAEMHANAHIAESDSLKAQLLAQIADNEKLRRANDVLEALLADGAQGVEYDIIDGATKDDLRVAEMAGWSIKHMQFSESGTLRVVLRRNKPNQPQDRKPAQIILHRAVYPSAPPCPRPYR